MNIVTKATGDSLTANEFNQIPDELEGAISSAGLTPDDQNLTQIAHAIQQIVADGNFYVASGTNSNIILSKNLPRKPISALTNGLTGYFKAVNSSLSAVTINVCDTGDKPAYINNVAVGDADIQAGRYYQFIYNLSADRYDLCEMFNGNDKLYNDITDYGAKGDGVTMDTTAISIAMQKEGITYVPDGTFLTEGTGLVNSTINFRGNGVRSEVKLDKTANRIFNMGTGSNGSTVENLYANGDIENRIAGQNIGCSVFSGTTYDQPIVQDITVQNCKVDPSGFDSLGSYRTKNLLWHNNRVNGGFDTVVDLVEGTKNFIVNNNFIKSNARFGIAMDTANETDYELVNQGIISNNIIEIANGDDVRVGIQNEDNEKVIISNQIIDASNISSSINFIGIRCPAGSKHIIIDNCILIGNNYSGSASGSGIEIDNTIGKLRKKNIIINNCIFINWRKGIQIYFADNVNISNCRFYNCSQFGINVDSSGTNAVENPTQNIQISNCYFSNMPNNAIRFGSPWGGKAIVNNCLYENCTGQVLAIDAHWLVDFFGDRLPSNVYMGGLYRLNGTYYAGSVPSKNTFERGDIIRRTNPSAGGYAGWICTQAGTNGTLSDITGSITSGENTLTVNSITNSLHIGMYITIAGVTGIKKITAIDNTNKILTLDTNADATVSGATVSYSNAVFKEYGAIAS